MEICFGIANWQVSSIFICLFEKRDCYVMGYGVCPSVHNLFLLANSSYSLHPIKLKLGI